MWSAGGSEGLRPLARAGCQRFDAAGDLEQYVALAAEVLYKIAESGDIAVVGRIVSVETALVAGELEQARSLSASSRLGSLSGPTGRPEKPCTIGLTARAT